MLEIPSDAGARRVWRRRVFRALLVVFALAVVGAVVLWVLRDPSGGSVQRAEAAAGESVGTRLARPSMASVPLPAPAAPASALVPADTARAPAEDNAACGIEPGPPASAPLSAAVAAACDARSAQAFERTMAAMQNSTNPQARAAGLILKPLIADLERVRKENPVLACEAPHCMPLPQPASAAEAAWMARAGPEANASFDALARMAATSTDSRIYAFAFHACDVFSGRRGGACQLITAGQWARLDPGNAVPWAFVAATAQRQGDAAAVREAMHQIAHARRSDHGWGVLPGLVLAHAPNEEVMLKATLKLLVAVIGVESAWVIPGYQTIGSFCKAEALADTNRRETCRQIAEVLTEKSDTMMDRGFGGSIGRRVGWSAERTDGIRAESARLSQAVADLAPDPERITCSELRRNVDYIRGLRIDGELGAMRRLAGTTPSNLGARNDDKTKPEGYPDRAN